MLLYQDIIRDTDGTDYGLTWFDNSLRMARHQNPVSITQHEFNVLYNFVSDNELKSGFEVATAFGISSLAAGFAMKQHGGKLVTMDAYIEEHYNDCSQYKDTSAITYDNADGYKTVKFLIQKYGLENVIYPFVGYSPRDTESVVNNLTQPVDYVFIDALHTTTALINDINGILPFLAKKFAIFLHDVHCFEEPAKQFIQDTFKTTWSIIPGCEYNQCKMGYNLAVINKL